MADTQDSYASPLLEVFVLVQSQWVVAVGEDVGEYIVWYVWHNIVLYQLYSFMSCGSGHFVLSVSYFTNFSVRKKGRCVVLNCYYYPVRKDYTIYSVSLSSPKILSVAKK
jgi:hypothetical protein